MGPNVPIPSRETVSPISPMSRWEGGWAGDWLAGCLTACMPDCGAAWLPGRLDARLLGREHARERELSEGGSVGPRPLQDRGGELHGRQVLPGTRPSSATGAMRSEGLNSIRFIITIIIIIVIIIIIIINHIIIIMFLLLLLLLLMIRIA